MEVQVISGHSEFTTHIRIVHHGRLIAVVKASAEDRNYEIETVCHVGVTKPTPHTFSVKV